MTLSISGGQDIADNWPDNTLSNTTPTDVRTTTNTWWTTRRRRWRSIGRHDPATSGAAFNSGRSRDSEGVTGFAAGGHCGGQRDGDAQFTGSDGDDGVYPSLITPCRRTSYDVTVDRGGDLWNRNAEITLSGKTTHDIADLAANALPNRTPIRTSTESYELDTTAPTSDVHCAPGPVEVAIERTRSSLKWRVTFSEDGGERGRGWISRSAARAATLTPWRRCRAKIVRQYDADGRRSRGGIWQSLGRHGDAVRSRAARTSPTTAGQRTFEHHADGRTNDKRIRAGQHGADGGDQRGFRRASDGGRSRRRSRSRRG